MKKFLRDCFLFSILCLFSLTIYGLKNYYSYSKYAEKKQVFKIPQNENFDIVLGGDSSANMEDPLAEVGFKNISLNTMGGGVLIQKAHLEYFFLKENTTKTILYFVGPSMLSTDQFDRPRWWRKWKPDLEFIQVLRKTFGIEKVGSYLKVCLKQSLPDGLYTIQKNPPKVVMESIDTLMANRRIFLNHRGYNLSNRLKQQKKFKQTIELLTKQQPETKVILITAPTLLGENEPNKNELTTFLKKIEKEMGIDYYDFSGIYNTPSTYKYFYNFDHLNTEGQTHFVENYLLQLLNEN